MKLLSGPCLSHESLTRCPLTGREKSSSHNYAMDEFEVDAVLPADVDGAPRANRKHTKVQLWLLFRIEPSKTA